MELKENYSLIGSEIFLKSEKEKVFIFFSKKMFKIYSHKKNFDKRKTKSTRGKPECYCKLFFQSLKKQFMFCRLHMF